MVGEKRVCVFEIARNLWPLGRRRLCRKAIGILWIAGFGATGASAQTNVTTQHNDIARTGANTQETVLTPANVNSTSFGKLFTQPVDGYVYAQPLYVAGVTMGTGTPQAGTAHNVVFVATQHDSVYAFDADSNGGASANPLWHITLLDAAHGAASGATSVPDSDVGTSDIVPEIGITGTPVIDTTTNTMYVVGKTKENGNYVQRLHALDITTGNEKFGGPVALSGSVPGTGTGSSGGTLQWDPKWENQRPGLLLLNGIVYIGFAAHGDNGPWHGWVLAYKAANLHQTSVYCASPNGIGSGVWMSGSGLAADIPDPANHPYGRMFIATGNGTYDALTPYTNNMDFGDDHVRLDLSNGVLTVQDSFTPENQAALNGADEDVAAGGILLLPDQSNGGHQRLLLQVGKEGKVYLVDRDTMGGYSTSTDNAVEEVTNASGVWGMPAYWNGHVYIWGKSNTMAAYSFQNGLLSSSPTSTTTVRTSNYSPTPSVSSNGNTNGIVWGLRSDSNLILYAYDATNLGNLLYASTQNLPNDPLGGPVKFNVPTIVNGKVYFGSQTQMNVFGLLNAQSQTATPVINPAGESFTGSLSVTITDSTPGASIYYTTNGTTPTTASTHYTGAISVSATETITAIAGATGYLQSAATSQTYTISVPVATPVISPGSGTYANAQTVTIRDTTSGATIYYTTDSSTPTTASTKYTGSFAVGATTTVKAIATASGFTTSGVASSTITVQSFGTSAISFGDGFSSAGIQFNGHAKLSGSRLRLTDSASNEASSAFWNQPVNVQAFTTDFTLQFTNAIAEGLTFTIQGTGLTALGPSGGGLGYGPSNSAGTPGIAKSVAVKFDIYNNAGEGTNSTGLYSNGASPTMPATTLGNGVSLLSGHPFAVHITYDGANLAMTITDTTNAAKTFTTKWPVNIPATVGGNTAYVGFTGATGGSFAIQEIARWTYSTSSTKTPVVYQTTKLTAVSSGPAFLTFAYAGLPDGTGTVLESSKIGDNVTFSVNVATAGTYDIQVSYKTYLARAISQLSVNGTKVGPPWDQYAPIESYATFDFGTFTFAAAGTYSFKFTATGKNPSSTGYPISFDDIVLTPQ
jgi:hypothetical protein